MEVVQQLRTEAEKKKEVLHHFKEEVEEAAGEALLLRRRSANIPTSGGNSITSTDEVSVDLDTSKMKGGVNGEGDQKVEKSEEIVYFDKNEGTGPELSRFNGKVEDLGAKLMNVDIHQVLTSVINGKEVDHLKSKLLPNSNLPTSTRPQLQEETEHAEVDEELEEGDEEVIELEFEKAVEKIHTHDGYNMYCPNCSNRITKVVLRRKIQRKRVQIPSDAQRGDLYGCLSCFRVFIPLGNKLNPIRLFGAGKKPESTPLLHQEQHTPDASMPTSGTTQDKGRGFDLFSIFGKRRPNENDLNSQLLSAADINTSSPKVTTAPRDQAIDQADGVKIFIPSAIPPLGLTESKGVVSVAAVGNGIQASTPSQGSVLNGNVIVDIYNKTEVVVKPQESEIKGQSDTLIQLDGGDVRIPVEETPVETRIPFAPITDVFLTDARIPVNIPESQSSRSLEIVKSVVYGGLIESITSVGVVSSAAASDATTLNIVALGLANLVGGLVVLAHNLRDLRYGDSSETNENRYKEQLGRKEHFPLHATIALLSYLVFGLIPPVVYGFTFRESDDRDYKLLAVAAASLLCIIILAIAKAYVQGEHKFMAYFKTIVYYVTSAVMVSGIAFAVGDLVNKLLEKLGWLKPATVEHHLFPQTKSFNPTSWASY